MTLTHIRSCFDGRVLFTATDAIDLRDAVMDAVRAGQPLNGAQLTQVSLIGDDLTDVDFSGADLTGADLRGANLTRTNFSGADLTGVRFDDATMEGTIMRGAITERGAFLRPASPAELQAA